MKTIVFIAFITLMSALYAQTQPAWMWGRFENNGIVSEYVEVVCDNQNNYYVVSAGSYSGQLTKYSSYGDQIWSSNLYNQSNLLGINPKKMVIDSQNNLYLLGTWDSRVMLAKIDSTGNFLWMRYTTVTNYSPGGNGSTNIIALTLDSVGNPVILYFGGTSYPTLTNVTWVGESYENGKDIRLMKFSTEGAVLINRAISYMDLSYWTNDHIAGLYCSQSGHIYLYGRTASNVYEGFPLPSGANNRNVFLCKYSDMLEPIQVKLLYSYQLLTDYPRNIVGAITESDDGSIIVSGGCFGGTWNGGPMASNGGWFTGKVGPDTNWDWLIPIGGHEIEKCPDGNYFIGNRGAICKINDNGELIHTETVTFSVQIPQYNDTSISVDSRNDCVIAIGYASGTAYFDEFQSSGSQSTFLGKVGVPRPEIVPSPLTLNLGSSSPGYESAQYPLTISNRGTGNLSISSFEFTTYQEMWNINGINLNDPGIVIQPRDSLVVMMSFVPTAVQAYTDTLLITYNNYDEPVKKVKLCARGENIPPAAAEGLEIDLSGYDAHLTWLPVTTTIYGTSIEPDGYVVLHSEIPHNDDLAYNFLAYVPSNQYTHHYTSLFRNRMFYKIVAVKFYREGVREFLTNPRLSDGKTNWATLLGMME